MWKRRWFVMRLTSLDFYKRRIKIPEEYEGLNKEDAEARARNKQKAQGSIKLGSIVRIQRDLVKYPQPFCFQLVCARTVHLPCKLIQKVIWNYGLMK